MAINQHFQDELGTSKTEAIARFLEKETLLANDIAESLANDPYVLASYKNWKNLNQNDKSDFTLYFARNVASNMGRYNPMVRTFDEAPDTKTGQFTGGFFNKYGQNGPTLNININPCALTDLKVHCEIVTHEETHDRQVLIMDGALRNAGPHIAEIMKWELQNFIMPEKSFRGYQDQLVEKHARHVSEGMTKKLFSALEKKEVCLLNRDEGEKIQKEYESGQVSIGQSNAVQTVDPRRYYFSAQLIEEKLKPNQGNHIYSEMITNYELAMRYGEYAHGFNAANAAKSLFMLAQNSDVPDFYQKQARTALEKYKSHQSTLGTAARMYSKRLDAITAARPINAVVTVNGRRTTAVLTAG